MDTFTLVGFVARSEPLAELPTPQRARELRQSAGVTLEAASALIGCCVSTLEKWESGDKPPTPRFCQQELAYRRLLAGLNEAARALGGALAEAPPWEVGQDDEPTPLLCVARKADGSACRNGPKSGFDKCGPHVDQAARRARTPEAVGL
jgi:transcriptional regulator with XRE-family HTH domain